MMNTAGFYKFEEQLLRFAPNAVYAPNFTLFISERETYTYPVAGWLYFNTTEEAEAYFQLNGRTQAQWAAFSDAIYSNQALKTAMASASTFLQVRLGVGLGLSRSGLAEDIESFALAWDDAVAEGLISPQLAAGFLQLAQQFNLPATFIDRLQGNL